MTETQLAERVEPSGLEAVSGIGDAVTVAPIGKLISAFFAETLRDRLQLQGKLLLLMNVPRNARIYTEAGGSGNKYNTVRFRSPDPETGKSRAFCFYLGRLDEDELKWAEGILRQRAEMHKMTYLTADQERIRVLTEFRKTILEQVRIAAKKAGYGMRNLRLLKRRTT
jgi:hypothetical protein